ncbi:MAG: rhomboid family intramembrane serine protease [Planctomycetota bacterium]
MIPVGDYPNPPKPQWVTRILIGINVAVHLFIAMPMESAPLTRAQRVEERARLALMWELQEPSLREDEAKLRRAGALRPGEEITREWWETKLVSQYDLFVFKWGYQPGAPSLLSLLFCMFLHGGLMHLFGNMLFLFIYGDNVEYRLGGLRFLIAYLATGVVATLSFAFLAGDSLVPLVGASGAISGVLGFYLIWFRNNYVKMFFFFPFFGIIPIRALWILLIYVVIENIIPLVAGADSNVAYGAHLGGFVAGAVAALAYNSIKGEQPVPKPDHFNRYRPGTGPVEPNWREMDSTPVDHGSEFEKAIAEGRMESAAHAFSRLNRKGGAHPREHSVFRLGEWLYDEGFSPDAAAVFRYFLKNYPRSEDTDRVHLGLGILYARRLGRPAAAREHLLQAIDTADTPGIAETARAELERLGG